MALEIFVVFPVVAVVFVGVILAPMCEALGEYGQWAVYKRPDFDAIPRDIADILRELDRRQ